MQLSKPITYLTVVLLTCVVASCSMRYGHIPRSHHGKNHAAKQTFCGHYVEPQKKNPNPVNIDSNEIVFKPKLKINLDQVLPTKLPRIDTLLPLNQHHILRRPVRKYVDSTAVTNASNKVDRSLIKDSGFVFAALTAINGAALATAYYNYMTLALVIAVGAIALGYLLSRLVKNMSETRLKPPQYRRRDMFETRRKLKRATGILFGVAGVLYAIALLLVNTAAFEASFGFFVAGTLVLYIALIVGLIYLVAGLF